MKRTTLMALSLAAFLGAAMIARAEPGWQFEVALFNDPGEVSQTYAFATKAECQAFEYNGDGGKGEGLTYSAALWIKGDPKDGFGPHHSLRMDPWYNDGPLYVIYESCYLSQ